MHMSEMLCILSAAFAYGNTLLLGPLLVGPGIRYNMYDCERRRLKLDSFLVPQLLNLLS